MHLVRDVLDARVVDRNGRDLGRVDRLIVSLRGGRSPTVAAIEVGASALGRRIGARCGRLVEALMHVLGFDEPALRIPFDKVVSIGDVVKVDLAVGETSAGAVEDWLRRWVRRVPFSG